MEGCADGPVAFHQMVDLDIYTADVSRSDPDAVVSCLLSVTPEADDRQIVARGPDLLATMFTTPFYSIYLAEPREERPAPAALIRSGATVHVLQPDADYGVEALQHVSGDAFVVSSGYVTHVRNALFRATAGNATRLSNGSEIEIQDHEALLFRVVRAKDFWKLGGAFWYDAIIDRRNHILNLVTPRTDFLWCMGLDAFADLSDVDVSRVTSTEVCLWGFPY